MEVQVGPFERRFRLPVPVDPESTRANSDQGFLDVRLAKLPARLSGPQSVRVQYVDRLPVLPLGRIVVYPHVVLPMALTDPHAVQLIDEVVQGNKRLLLGVRSEEHTSELQSHSDLVCRLLLEKKKNGRSGEAYD